VNAVRKVIAVYYLTHMKHINTVCGKVQSFLMLKMLSELKTYFFFRYRAKLINVGPSGVLTASVGRHSVYFRGRVDYTDNICTVTSVEVKVRDLQDMKLKLTGLSPFNWILSKIATSVTSRSKFNIARAIEETVGNKIRDKLKDFDCRQYFPESAVRAVDPVDENTESGQNEL
jgi:hypothetical protein